MTSKYRKRITIGHTIDNKPIIKCIYANSKTELQRKVDDFKYNMRTGEYIDRITFASWAEEWLDTFKRNPGKLSDSSIYLYELCVDHLNKYFGSRTLLCDISVNDLQKFFNQYSLKSKSLCDKLKVTTKSIFKKAQANGFIKTNPCEGVEFPPGIPADEKRSYTKDQYRCVLKFSKENEHGIGVYTILSTGMRRGELMGFIPSEDIDFNRGLVFVRRTVTDNGGVVRIKEGGKTKRATRAIPVQREFLEVMKRYDNGKFLLPGKYRPYRSPKVWAQKDYDKYFVKDLKKSFPDIPSLRPHELRHTFGTLLYKAGTDIYTIQKIMGHASVDITTKIYVHDDEDDLIKNIRFI